MRFLCVLCLGLFCSSSFGQEAIAREPISTRTASPTLTSAATPTDDTAQTTVPAEQKPAPDNLADAPSATQSTCTEKNGKPCPEWVHKLIGQYPPIDQTERWNGQSDHFFSFGNTRRALHPDKKSWMLFAAAHAGLWASTVIAVRNHQTSKEQAHSEYPAAAFMTGLDLLIFKTFNPALSIGPPVFGMVHYSRAAAK